MYRKNCGNCKWFRWGICTHPDMIEQESYARAITEHVEIAFDGNIQALLNETVEQYCKDMDDTTKEDFIESICTTASNYLTDPRNMYLEDEGFQPDADFVCINWE